MKDTAKPSTQAANHVAHENSQETKQTRTGRLSLNAQAQAHTVNSINSSPRMVAQRQRIAAYLGHGGTVQREEGEEPLQGRFVPGMPMQLERQAPVKPNASTQLSTNNTGLPDNLKSGIESLSGMSMDNVKVHYNSSQPAQLNALAYAQGSDIHIAPGQEQHLPHEAWHVVQQAQRRVKPTLQAKGVRVNDDEGLESEANVMGRKAEQINRTGHVRGNSVLPANNYSFPNNSSMPLQRVIVGYDGKPIQNLDVFGQTGVTQEHRNIIKGLHEDKTKEYDIYEAIEIAESTKSNINSVSVNSADSSAGGKNSASAASPMANVKPNKPKVISISVKPVLDSKNDMKLPAPARAIPLSNAAQANQIINDMNRQFKEWDGTMQNRGAWWGSQSAGDIKGAKDVPKELIDAVKKTLDGKNGWYFKDSFSGGLSFHKKYEGIDFIYHMKAPK